MSFAELSIGIDSRIANISRAIDLAGFGLERHVLHGSDTRYFSGVLNLLDGDLLFSQCLTFLSMDGDMDLILKIKEIIRNNLVMHSELSQFSYDLRRIDDDDLVELSSLLGFSFRLPLWLSDNLCDFLDDLLVMSRLISAIKSLYLILRISRLSDFGKHVDTLLARSRLAELSEKVRKHSLSLKEGEAFRRYIYVLGKS
jgi:hypothetical protein